MVYAVDCREVLEMRDNPKQKSNTCFPCRAHRPCLTGYTLLAIIFHQQVRRSLLCFLILENHSTQIERNLFNVSKWINFSLPIPLLRVYCRRWVLCVERKRRALWMVTVRNNLSVTFHITQDPHINHRWLSDCAAAKKGTQSDFVINHKSVEIMKRR